ncbi:hypothetical protein CYLTODRAFT_452016 [Cylindrobasidium torrendii FP15055 ss-10]|uniref:C2H2-type domain-containing protein n=1 Tax=Cylindrobasidium torrendii FP15055 ss-10 TaxID=1314674 RepID=A0A0D7BKF5_9AGAR|nr:hypothetical protein CYLTODRAFT_452016 [Cylindrobasidium torrendii FP15055 ss-10]
MDRPSNVCSHAGCAEEFPSLEEKQKHEETHEQPLTAGLKLDEPPQKPTKFICTHPECGKQLSTIMGLRRHERVHVKSNIAKGPSKVKRKRKEPTVDSREGSAMPPSPTKTEASGSDVFGSRRSTPFDYKRPRLAPQDNTGVFGSPMSALSGSSSQVAKPLPDEGSISASRPRVLGKSIHRCTKEYCEYQTTNFNHMKGHELAHDGMRPFRCGMGSCKFGGKTKDQLFTHRTLVHGKAPVSQAESSVSSVSIAGITDGGTTRTESNVGLDSPMEPHDPSLTGKCFQVGDDLHLYIDGWSLRHSPLGLFVKNIELTWVHDDFVPGFYPTGREVLREAGGVPEHLEEVTGLLPKIQVDKDEIFVELDGEAMPVQLKTPGKIFIIIPEPC